MYATAVVHVLLQGLVMSKRRAATQILQLHPSMWILHGSFQLFGVLRSGFSQYSCFPSAGCVCKDLQGFSCKALSVLKEAAEAQAAWDLAQQLQRGRRGRRVAVAIVLDVRPQCSNFQQAVVLSCGASLLGLRGIYSSFPEWTSSISRLELISGLGDCAQQAQICTAAQIQPKTDGPCDNAYNQ